MNVNQLAAVRNLALNQIALANPLVQSHHQQLVQQVVPQQVLVDRNSEKN